MSAAADRRDSRTERRRRRDRAIGGGTTVVVHGLVLAAVLLSPSPRPRAPEEPPMEVALVAPAPPPAVQAPPAPPAPRPAKAASAPPAPKKPERRIVKAAARPPPPQRPTRKPEPSDVPPRLVPPAPPLTEAQVSAAELASATTAESEAAGAGGSGLGDGFGAGAGSGGGGRCDMVGRLQRALRGDARVRAAIAGAPRAPGFTGRPLVIWNGDWVRHGEEEGKGLASVRQAIAVEVGFAPKACRNQSMHGLVLLSLNDAPGAARLVLGAGAWRWSDLLLAR